jgi:diguanylate cyclase (GGDEF)-like protein
MDDLLRGFVGADAERIAAAYRRLKETNEPFDLDGEYLTPGGEQRCIRVLGRTQMRGASPVRLLGAFQDTTARKAAEATIAHLAHHDSLTGLPNRLLFSTKLDAAIAAAEQAGSRFAVLIVDFDHFKKVNDRHGHAAGDDLLKYAAAVLTEDLGPGCTVARLGGDEFGLIVPEIADSAAIAAIAERVAMRLKFTFSSGSRNIPTSATVGAAVFPDDGTAAGELLSNADIALYSAKAERRGRAVLFRAEMRQRVECRDSLLADIRRGLQAGEFELFYQPIVGRIDRRGAAVDVEALMRWRHPVHGLMTPAFFGIGFEEPEVATLLGEVALAQGFAQLREWVGAGLTLGRLAINLAPAQVHADGFLQRLAERIRRENVPADRLTLEITEGTYLNSDSEHLTADLQALQAMGVAISLDDFGTGYGSLCHLRHFSVDQIKIDRSFVAGIGRDIADASIVQAMINLGRALNLDVVAEGVERAEQADFLGRSGCRHMQGFHFARPLPAAEAAAFIARFSAGAAAAAHAALPLRA